MNNLNRISEIHEKQMNRISELMGLDAALDEIKRKSRIPLDPEDYEDERLQRRDEPYKYEMKHQ